MIAISDPIYTCIVPWTHAENTTSISYSWCVNNRSMFLGCEEFQECMQLQLAEMHWFTYMSKYTLNIW